MSNDETAVACYTIYHSQKSFVPSARSRNDCRIACACNNPRVGADNHLLAVLRFGAAVIALFGCGNNESAPTGLLIDGGDATAEGSSKEAESGEPLPDSGCPDGSRTTISGRVYDPAGGNPLYNIRVFVPAVPLGLVPTGPSCNSCLGLYPPQVASAITDTAGNFVMEDPPTGTNIPVVVQAGKWRKQYRTSVAACQDNPVPDKTLRLPRNRSEGDLPQIAISTGAEDSLECVLRRIGVDPGEYVAGAASAGHVHIFAGQGALGGATVAGASTPDPSLALWDKLSDIMPYDVVVLSCEGAETAHLDDAGKQVLLDYAANGGRVFASHFHYAWFDTGPFATTAPLPLAAWMTGAQTDQDPISGKIDTVLANGMPFPEGVALAMWLGNVGALQDGGLPLHHAHDNALVPALSASQDWVSADESSNEPGAAEYLSFDTPLGSADARCGRIVYSDLDVGGGPSSADPNSDYPEAGPFDAGFRRGVVPDQCAGHPLTPQEKVLEFLLFELPVCLVPGSIDP
jgi:hypothetical protein